MKNSWWPANGQTAVGIRDADRNDTYDNELGAKLIEQDEHWGLYL